MICDFCSAPDPTVEYKCEDFDMIGDSYTSVGSWWACQQCSTLIINEQWLTLDKRAWDCYEKAHPPVEPENVPILKIALAAFHEQFRAHRIE